MSNVNVQTVYCVNPDANEDKYYRVFTDGSWIVIQYGPNATVGYGNLSWRPANGDGFHLATDMINKKVRKGYHDKQSVSFEYSPAVDTTRPTLESLVNAYTALQSTGNAPTAAGAAPVIPPTPEQVADRFASFTDRALKAISLSVTDRQKATVELTVLNDQWEELEEVHTKAASYMNTLTQMLAGAKV